MEDFFPHINSRAPSRTEEGFVSLELLMAENNLSIVIEPGVGLEPSFVTRHADSKRRWDASPAEEPEKDKGFFQAGGPHGVVSTGDLH